MQLRSEKGNWHRQPHISPGGDGHIGSADGRRDVDKVGGRIGYRGLGNKVAVGAVGQGGLLGGLQAGGGTGSGSSGPGRISRRRIDYGIAPDHNQQIEAENDKYYEKDAGYCYLDGNASSRLPCQSALAISSLCFTHGFVLIFAGSLHVHWSTTRLRAMVWKALFKSADLVTATYMALLPEI